MSITPNDTIAAIATSLGEAGISVVRVSGPDALPIADRVVRQRKELPSQRPAGTFTLEQVIDGERVVDQVLVLVMRAPHSYTGEDVVEFQGHGGSQCAKSILRVVCNAGARLAEPGEFTQRAFLNGRMDLVQAEAVLDLIHARSNRAAAAALDQLQGQLSQALNSIYDDLIALAADLEATLDFPEDELPDAVLPEIIDRGQRSMGQIQTWLDTWEEGHLLRDGALVVIAGRPNAGKSTLLNALLGRERAIVSGIPGTTRDTIEEDLVLKGIPIRLIDTAGLRDTECEIEQFGIARTHQKRLQADLEIYLIDATLPPDPHEINNLSTDSSKRRLVILNKIDQANPEWETPQSLIDIKLSILKHVDIEAVKSLISVRLVAGLDLEARPHAVISERHYQLLSQAKHELESVIAMLLTTHEDEVALASTRMRDVLDLLGNITGRTYHDELLNTIFSRFCIGK